MFLAKEKNLFILLSHLHASLHTHYTPTTHTLHTHYTHTAHILHTHYTHTTRTHTHTHTHTHTPSHIVVGSWQQIRRHVYMYSVLCACVCCRIIARRSE